MLHVNVGVMIRPTTSSADMTQPLCSGFCDMELEAEFCDYYRRAAMNWTEVED